MHLQQYFEDDELQVELQVPIIADFNIIAGVSQREVWENVFSIDITVQSQ